MDPRKLAKMSEEELQNKLNYYKQLSEIYANSPLATEDHVAFEKELAYLQVTLWRKQRGLGVK